jgi:hypothetical protein
MTQFRELVAERLLEEEEPSKVTSFEIFGASLGVFGVHFLSSWKFSMKFLNSKSTNSIKNNSLHEVLTTLPTGTAFAKWQLSIGRKMYKTWRSSRQIFSQIWLYIRYEVQIFNCLFYVFGYMARNQVWRFLLTFSHRFW